MSTSGETRIGPFEGQYLTGFDWESHTAPVAGTVLATINGSAPGTYHLRTVAMFGATADVATNVHLFVEGVDNGPVPMSAGANGHPCVSELVVRLSSTLAVELHAAANGAAGSVYLTGVFLTRII